MSAAPVIVVGAGIGGLSAALLLAARGVDVLVLERAEHAGGKLREVALDGQAIDAGPTVLTMRWVFDELFDQAGAVFTDRLGLSKVGTLARHAWNRNQRLDLFTDMDRSVDAIGRFSGAADAQRYIAFCARAEAIYRTLEGPFLRDSQPNPVSLARRVGWRGLGGLARISPFATMWSALGDHFHDPRLRQLFGRYATYCGSSPFLAPATLMLVAHVEREGVWLVDGGMRRIADAVAALLEERGGRLRCGVQVDEITVDGGRASGVRLADGERIAASAVVFNGDTGALAGGLLGRGASMAVPPTRRDERSLSAITWHLRAKTGGFPLLRHDVFFGDDSPREFDDLFVRRTLPGDPTVYLCAQDRDAHDENGARVIQGPERLMCLVNAPADADTRPPTSEEIARCQDRMFQKLSSCGLVIEAMTAPAIVTTPVQFGQRFPGTGGALYGRATHGWKASFDRPAARSRIPGLYLVGGSVHPGPGLPMAALSGRLAATSLMADLDSIARSRATATRGGTSTR